MRKEKEKRGSCYVMNVDMHIYLSTKASDQAHLHNERIRLRNLNAGRRIIKTLLQDLGRHDLLSSQ